MYIVVFVCLLGAIKGVFSLLTLACSSQRRPGARIPTLNHPSMNGRDNLWARGVSLVFSHGNYFGQIISYTLTCLQVLPLSVSLLSV